MSVKTLHDTFAALTEQLLAFQGHQAGHHIVWLLDANNGDGARMFLPAAGYYNDTILHDLGEFGNYWTSSLYERHSFYAWQLLFSPVRPLWFNGYRFCGMSIRPVYQRP